MSLQVASEDKSEGFTLIEILLVVAIFGMLGLISTPLFSKSVLKTSLVKTSDQLVSQLRKAQIYSMSGKKNSSWGVAYYDGDLILFNGENYSSRNASLDETTPIRENIEIQGLSEIVFQKITGRVDSPYNIELSAGGKREAITVNETGNVTGVLQ